MKNQYFGDINDYLKYALLRALSGRGEFRTLVAWMLTHDDGGRDGRKLDYLKSPARYRHLDPEVFDFLETASTLGGRGVGLIEASGLLPNSRFQPDFLTDDETSRQGYFIDLVERYPHADWVFFDPDNGLEVNSRLPGRRDYSKYLASSEAAYAYRSGLSVLVYQHFPHEARDSFIVRTRDRLLAETGAPEALVFVTPNVGFFLLPQERHQAIVWRRTAFLIQSAGSLLWLWAPDVKPHPKRSSPRHSSAPPHALGKHLRPSDHRRYRAYRRGCRKPAGIVSSLPDPYFQAVAARMGCPRAPLRRPDRRRPGSAEGGVQSPLASPVQVVDREQFYDSARSWRVQYATNALSSTLVRLVRHPSPTNPAGLTSRAILAKRRYMSPNTRSGWL